MLSTSISELLDAPPATYTPSALSRSESSRAANHLLIQPNIHMLVEGVHIVTDTSSSQAALVLFVEPRNKAFPLCFKFWRPFNNDIYATLDIDTCNRYTLEGFYFNRLQAPGIYLGIAPIRAFQDQVYIALGSLLTDPTPEDLEQGVAYALVMKYLPQEWRLDQQIHQRRFGKHADMQILADAIAQMHKYLDPSPSHLKEHAILLEKWKLNKGFFREAITSLQQLFPEQDFISTQHQIIETMDSFLQQYSHRFQARQQYIRRCHGDLKVNNLWIAPSYFATSSLAYMPFSQDPLRSHQLLALDCIDFKDEFAHIDPFSDIAMLAMDLEAHLLYAQNHGQLLEDTPARLVDLFLGSYFWATGEEPEAILEFYVIEKAMIRTYNCILFENQPNLGILYLSIACKHTRSFLTAINQM